MQAKVVLIGDGSVGKSTIRERYLGIAYRPAYLQTVGADFTMKDQVLSGGNSLSLQIWDLAGQQGFFNIRDSYYKGTDGVVLIFDVSKPKTAERINDWVKEVKRNVSKNIPILLVGNKIDLRANSNSITFEQGQDLAKKLSKENKLAITYLESSAKTGENVEEIFYSIANSIIDFKTKGKRNKDHDTSFESYLNEVKDHVDLYFFKMLDDGPSCTSQTSSINDPELMIKMAIFYSTALGQGSSAHTGLFGPFPLPESNQVKFSGQSLIYSFKKTDKNNKDDRIKKINFCFIVITIEKNLMYQFNNDNSLNRFFFDELERIGDVGEINTEFLFQLKQNLLHNVWITSGF